MDIYKKYNILGAAGDRHLVEFMNNNWYIKNPQMVKDYAYSLTTVDFRRVQQKERIEDSLMLASGLKDIKLLPSGEEAVDLMKAILGLKMKVSNINLPNYGQVPGLPYNSIVESNCIFSADSVKPIISKKLPDNVLNLVYQNSNNIDTLYEGIKRRDLNIIFTSFLNQPLLSNLSFDDAKELFIKMVIKTRKYLDKYYDLDKYIKK
jgi:alpha-galactosidase